MNITNTVSWKNLHIDLERLNGIHLNDLFSKDPNRFAKFSFSKDDLHIDFSKEFIDNSVLDNLIKLAKECDIEKQRDAMFSGQHINNTENRAVMHVALRANSNDAYEVDGIKAGGYIKDNMFKYACIRCFNHIILETSTNKIHGYKKEIKKNGEKNDENMEDGN